MSVCSPVIMAPQRGVPQSPCNIYDFSTILFNDVSETTYKNLNIAPGLTYDPHNDWAIVGGPEFQGYSLMAYHSNTTCHDMCPNPICHHWEQDGLHAEILVNYLITNML